ncbi:transcription initiation factor TFIID subunit 4 isoform X3 [Hermetia illucens]|uniref:transcription initiation factor TFIID subunit 4 isoform X3 n=1 Tax=Hermetia illucens TaxID=343691 RepID=UPI0018CC6E98|nr:transcription initiation factor TFIID subunit 4 isoform X3 [Hermetia illucens]
MASAAKLLDNDAPLNAADITNSEVSPLNWTSEKHCSDSRTSPTLNNNSIKNLKAVEANNNIDALSHITSAGVAISDPSLTSNGHHHRQSLQQAEPPSQQPPEKTAENPAFRASVSTDTGKFSDPITCVTESSSFPVTEAAQQVANAKIESVGYSHCQKTPPPLLQFSLAAANPSITTYPGALGEPAPPGNPTSATTYQHSQQNMPKSNEPIKLVYPISTSNSHHSSSQQQSQQTHSSQASQIVTMNSSSGAPQQQAGNRVTFTSQSLPNGTINITTSQPSPQQIMHAVSSAGIPITTTIKTITAATGTAQQIQQQAQQQAQQNQANQNIVSTSTMLPASVQIVGMRPGAPTQNQQKNAVSGLSPRVVIGGPMVGARPQSPAITLNALQPGQAGSALLLKTETGYQLLRVGPPSATPVAQNIPNSGNQTIRLQTVPATVASVASSIAAVNSVISTNTTQVLATSNSTNIQQPQQTVVASVAPVPIQSSQPVTIQQQQSQTQHQQIQQQQVVQAAQTVASMNNAATSTTTGVMTQTHAPPTPTQNAASQKKPMLQGNTKEKCRKFLANLIELSSREPKPVEKNVRTLIQELIDANVEPEEFCDRLERLLNASPQPCLIGFLKKSLPLLRQSLFTKELVIEGIKPPPQHVVGVIGSTTLTTTQLPKIQAQIRPIGQQTTTIGQTQVKMVTQTAPRPVGQTTITKQTAGGVRIQGPLTTSIGISNTGPRLMNAQIRPVGVPSTPAGLVQSSNIQSPPALQPVTGSQTSFTPTQNVVQIRTTNTNRPPATVQIRATAPIIRPTTPGNKSSGPTITQVKVGQTQIKQITAPNATVSVPVNSNLTVNSNNSSTPTNASTNKVVTIKAQSAQQASSKKDAKEKDKSKALTTSTSAFFQQSSVSSSMYGDDDINDVAAMGGVNLIEESQRILGSTEMIGTQIRSCKDEVFLHLPALQSKIRAIVAKHGLEEPNQEVAVLISHACQERLKNIVEKLAVIAEHRIDVIKLDPRYEITKDVRGQIKFLEELDKAEQKRHEEQEREMLLRAAKSRSKIEDPEQAKLKAKAKEMQRAEMEELRQRDANMTALQAIGPRKKPKLDGDAVASSIQTGTTGLGTTGISAPPLRPRIKRVNLRDMLFFMEQERETCRSTMLYKAYLK